MRDVTLGEDASRVRREAAPQVMAALRNSIVHVLENTSDSLAAAVRTMSNCFNKAQTILGLPQLEELNCPAWSSFRAIREWNSDKPDRSQLVGFAESSSPTIAPGGPPSSPLPTSHEPTQIETSNGPGNTG
jgi:hypothetical protein